MGLQGRGAIDNGAEGDVLGGKPAAFMVLMARAGSTALLGVVKADGSPSAAVEIVG